MTWDPRILTNFKKDDIGLLYDKVYPGLLLYAIKQLGVQKDYLAEDCVQDALFQAWRRKESFNSIMALKSFLYITIRNYAISIHRKNNAHNRYLGREDLPIVDDHALIVDLEAQSILFNAINELPDNMRKVIQLSFIDGLKNQEIADRLEISLSSVNQYKAESLRILRKKIKSALFLILYIKVLQ